MTNWSDPANVIASGAVAVQIALLSAVIWYAVETKRLRVQAENQTEGLYKPCLTLWPALRDRADAILGFDGAEGIFVLGANEGAVVVQNVGNGGALNVRYDFDAIDPPDGINIPHPEGYFPMIVAQQKIRLPLAVNSLGVLDWRVHLTYETMGGRQYRTSLKVVNKVITEFHIAEVNRHTSRWRKSLHQRF